MAANWTLDQVFTQMYRGQRWSESTITYAFPSSVRQMVALQGEGTGFRAVEPAQQTLMVLAIATWDDLIPQAFAPGTPGATQIEFGYTSTGIGFAHGYFPPNGSIYFNANSADLVNAQIGRHGFVTFIHEIGHTLGLRHMGDYDGDGNWSPSSYQDTMVLSIMSYFGPRETAPNYSAEIMPARWVGADGSGYSPQTPMVNDVMAIQRIYGTSTTTRTGDTVYGFNSTVTGSTAQLYNFAINRNPILTIFDSGGTDTLDLSGFSTASRIDLAPGAFSAANGMTNNLAIAYNTAIENAVGGPANDQLFGNTLANRLDGGGGNDELYGLDGDDLLTGGPGSDLLDGGAGTDTAIFAAPFGSFTISLTANAITLSSALTGSDRAVSIERFQFSDSLRTLADLSPGSDGTPPLLTTLSPADNAVGVAPGTNLVLTFNEAVKAGGGVFTVFNGDGTVFRTVSASDTSQVTFAGSTAVVDLAIDLVAGRSYYVTVAASAVTDLAGNPFVGLAGTTAWNFSTASTDTTAPRLVSLQPADDSAGVAPGANLVMQFDEPVRAGSGSIVIRSGNQVLRTISIGDTSQVSIAGSTLTINPATDLPAGAAVSVTVDGGALRDAAGNAYAGLSGTTAWNFSVVAAAGDDYPDTIDTPGAVPINGAASSGVIETVDDVDLFRVELGAGVDYTFELQRTAGGLADPLLALLDAQYNVLAADDDGGGAGNARLGFTPTRSGTYYLAAFDYGSGTGAYTLRATTQDAQPPTLVSRSPADDATQVPTGADLVLGFSEPVTAGSGLIRILSATGATLREIRASDTTAVRISGTTVTIDPGANLPAGASFSITIDAGAFRDVAGNPFAGISGSTAWNFSTAAVTGTDDFPMSVNTPGVVPVNGAPISARIDDANDGDLFRVALTAGVTYRFDANRALGSSVDTYLSLYGTLPEATLIGFNDDRDGTTFDSRLYFTPSTSGNYYLSVWDYAEATGRYTVSAISPADDYLGSVATTGRVAAGGTPTGGTIGVPSDIDMFAVTLAAGAQYTFELSAGATGGLEDPYLVLLDAQGNQLEVDDDTGVGLDSLLTYTVPAAGTYYLAAMDYDDGTGSYQIAAYLRIVTRGTAGNDSLGGTGGRDTLEGGAGNDTLRGLTGDDILQGGPGIDIGRYAGPVGNYFLDHMESSGGWVVRDVVGSEGRDLAYEVERLLFDDGYWALDVDGHAGVTARLLGAVFGPTSVRNEAYVGIGLTLLDGGMSEAALAQLALDARLGPGASPSAIVDLLWFNLFGTHPDAATRLPFERLLTGGSFTPAALTLVAAETEENLTNIGFEQIWSEGLGYVI